MSEETVISTEPSPIVVIAAFTEAFKAVLGEIRSIAVESFRFQLQMMETLPAEDRLEALKAVIEANSAAILSDERVTVAMLATVEKLGAAAAAVIPAIIADRRAEITDRAARRAAEARETRDHRAVAGINGKSMAEAK